ncbi:MAG: chromate efflux transporter [Spirochaetes bacterium]|nr:chromate efflux transporter [Spirochaetota bacterium]MBU0955000.1 chromate efflux transporter [Spirochaetota bacterium]
MHSTLTHSPEPGTPVAWPRFLKDVFVCSLGAYGGPEAHFGVFMQQLVQRRRYLSEEELLELLALCSMLPGPTSTQTIVAVGYKKGGPVLALLTMLVWALPVLALMTAFSFLYQLLSERQLSANFFRWVGPMAVGFIISAAWRIGRKVAKDWLTVVLLVGSALLSWQFRQPWVFPLLLLAGGLSTMLAARQKDMFNRVQVRPRWLYLLLFGGIAAGALVLAGTNTWLLADLFEKFYRFGYLVFGGGQVVVPLMYTELVEVNGYLSGSEFLTGYGLVQGLPGPMFSFAAWAGALAARSGGTWMQLAGAVAGGVGIFLPGLLLIYFIYPLWEELKQIKAIKLALRGINAAAGGLIISAGLVLLQRQGLQIAPLAVSLGSAALLLFTKLPATLLVVAALGAGLLF